VGGGARLYLALALAAGLPSRAEPPPELRTMASTISLLADWVTWPPDRAKAPLVIGVFGTCPMGPWLRESCGSKLIQGRRVEVVTFRNLYGLDRCDLLFICEGDAERIPDLLKQLRGRPVLTVGDMAGMGEAGVMVNLVPERGKLTLEVNLAAVRRGGLVLSSKVLKLAKIIEPS
jgi:hypothetical protein